jgi:hypothetical protein
MASSIRNTVALCAILIAANAGARSAAAGFGVNYGDHYLVAGIGGRGFRDGAYLDAAFNGPQGLAVDEAGRRLFVADSGNQRIRAVDLAHRHAVSTLAGSGQAGATDGPLLQASFDAPTELAIGGGHLFVLEAKGTRIRDVDLAGGQVSTRVVGKVLQGLAAQPDGALLWSDASGALWRSSGPGAAPELRLAGRWDGQIAGNGLLSNGSLVLARGGYLLTMTAQAVGVTTLPEAIAVNNMDGWPGALLGDDWVRWDTLDGSFVLVDLGTGVRSRWAIFDVDGHILPGRPAFQDVRGMAYDADRDAYYVSEGDSGRLQAVKRYRLSPRTLDDVLLQGPQPRHSPAGRRKALWLGDSMLGAMIPEDQQTVGRRFEQFASELAAQRGLDLDLEAGTYDPNLGNSNVGPISTVLSNGGALWAKNMGATDLFLELTAVNMVSEMLSFATNPTEDGLPSQAFEEWILLPWSKRKPHLTAPQLALMDHLFKHYPKSFGVNSDGMLIFGRGDPGLGQLFNDPVVMDAMLARMGYLSDRLTKALAGSGIRAHYIIFPTRPYLTAGEVAPDMPGPIDGSYLRGRLAAFAKARKLSYFDPTDLARLSSAVRYPLSLIQNYHLASRGHELYGRLVAQWFVDQLAAPPAEAPSDDQ